jgi:hypothetical protein
MAQHLITFTWYTGGMFLAATGFVIGGVMLIYGKTYGLLMLGMGLPGSMASVAFYLSDRNPADLGVPAAFLFSLLIMAATKRREQRLLRRAEHDSTAPALMR